MNKPLYDQAKRTAATAETLALIAFSLIAMTVAINIAVPAVRILGATTDASLSERIRATMTIVVPLIPAVLFLVALRHLQRVLREYEKGEFFSAASARAVRLAGEEALIAQLAHMLLAPAILSWISVVHHFAPHFELVDFAHIAFFLFIAAVGRVLDLAVAIKSDNDQIV